MIPTLQKAAKEAGEVLLKYFQKGVSVSYKTSHQNIITQADIAAQEIIQKIITKEMKLLGYKKEDIGFIGEENLNIRGKHIFIIDPLDGTTNFASGLPHFGVSIAYARDKNIFVSVVYIPTKDEYFIVEKGRGAYKIKDKKRQKLSTNYVSLTNCLVAAHVSSEKNLKEKQFKIYQRLLPSVRQIRMMGSAVLDTCYIADNIFGLYVNPYSFIWDIAAAKLIVEESGGVAVDWQGDPIIYDFNHPEKHYQIIACHPKILSEVLKFFNK